MASLSSNSSPTCGVEIANLGAFIGQARVPITLDKAENLGRVGCMSIPSRRVYTYNLPEELVVGDFDW
jgi:hypothetical protein